MKLDKVTSALKKYFWFFVITITLFLAVTLSAMRIAMPHLATYIPEVEAVLSAQLNAEVTVQRMDSGWQGFGPAIRFEEVDIFQPETGLLLARANHLDVQLNVWASILQRQWVPGRLTLDGLVLTLVRTENSSLKIQGFDDVLSEKSFNIFDLAKRFRRVDIKKSFFTIDLLQGEPIDLDLKYFSLSPRGGDYRLEADLRHQTNSSRLNIIADLQGEITKPKQLEVDGYISLKSITYDGRFMHFALDNIKPERGTLNLSTWFKWKKGKWQQVIGDITLTDSVLTNGLQSMPFALSAGVAWKQQGKEQWQLIGDDISLEMNGIQSPINTFLLQAEPAKHFDLKLNAIAIDDISKYLNFSQKMPDAFSDLMQGIQASGELADIQLTTTLKENNFTDWQLGLKVNHWQQKNYGKIPSLKNISGELMLAQGYGQFNFESHNVVLASNDIFSQEIHLDAVNGLITWHDKDDVLQINASKIILDTEHFTATTGFEVLMPEDYSKTKVKLFANTGGLSTDVALTYVPVGILPPKVVAWLYASVERGNIADVSVILDGPVMEFPFRENQGQLEIRISGGDLDLTYHKDWPMLQDLSGEVVIDTKTVQAYLDSGYFYHSEIEQAKVLVKLAPITEPLYLTASGIAVGPASDLVHFLERSPLLPRMQATFDQVDIEGSLHLDLDLKVPLRALTPEQKNFNVSGVATLDRGEVQLKNWDLAFSDVEGSLSFTEKMLSATEINGMLLGKPARLDVRPVQYDSGYQMNWLLTSTFTPELLNERFPNDLWVLLSGETDYSAQFHTYIPKLDKPLQLEILTDLTGMQINTPAPLGKEKEEAVDMRFAGTQGEENASLARFEYGKLIHALIALQKTDNRYQVERGHVVLGGEAPQHLSDLEGLDISGQLEEFRLDDWLTFMKEYSPTKQTSYPEWQNAKVLIDKLHYQKYTLNNAEVSLQHELDAWNFAIDSDELLGDIIIPDATQKKPLVFDMQRCNWPALRGSTTQMEDPNSIIAFDFICHDMKIGERQLGYVRLATTPQEDGVLFSPITIRNNVGSIEATGSWLHSNGNTQTQFTGSAATDDLSHTLDNLGFSTDIRNAKGDLEFNLVWPGTPLNLDKEKLTGQIDAHLTKGRIVDVNPGFGRIIGLFSVQSLQRRLRLDFSDVFREGFSFDSFNGTATIAQGKMFTKDARLKAPSANIDISGQAGLIDQQLDFNIYMKANVDATIPAAAVAIANPIAGAAVWLAGKMFNPLGSRAYYHYHVSGTWEEPEFTDLTQEYRSKLGERAPAEEVEELEEVE